MESFDNVIRGFETLTRSLELAGQVGLANDARGLTDSLKKLVEGCDETFDAEVSEAAEDFDNDGPAMEMERHYNEDREHLSNP